VLNEVVTETDMVGLGAKCPTLHEASKGWSRLRKPRRWRNRRVKDVYIVRASRLISLILNNHVVQNNATIHDEGEG